MRTFFKIKINSEFSFFEQNIGPNSRSFYLYQMIKITPNVSSSRKKCLRIYPFFYILTSKVEGKNLKRVKALNVFHNSRLIQKRLQNQQLLLILYTFLNQMRVAKKKAKMIGWTHISSNRRSFDEEGFASTISFSSKKLFLSLCRKLRTFWHLVDRFDVISIVSIVLAILWDAYVV